MADINETITTLTMEYLKPEYPVYKIEVVESKVKFDDSSDIELLTHKKTLILEADDKFYDNWKGNNPQNQINRTDKRCSLSFINNIKKKIELFKSITYVNQLQSWYILSCERIS